MSAADWKNLNLNGPAPDQERSFGPKPAEEFRIPMSIPAVPLSAALSEPLTAR